MSNRDIHNLETRFAVVAQPICRTSISVVRSLEVSAGACLSSLPLPGGTRGLCWTRAAAGILRKIVFQHRLKAVVAHYIAGSFFGRRQGSLFQLGFNCVILTSPQKCLAARYLFLSLQCVSATTLCCPCVVEPHPRKGSLMSAGERGTAFIFSISTESEQGCKFSSPIGVG